MRQIKINLTECLQLGFVRKRSKLKVNREVRLDSLHNDSLQRVPPTKNDLGGAMIRAGIVGATGYTGSELVKLLWAHPNVSLDCVMARRAIGQSIADFFPALRGLSDLTFEAWSPEVVADLDVLFFATPHGVAAASAAEVVSQGCKVIDLSADFRLRDLSLYEKWYGQPHAAPQLMADSAYGLPELFATALKGCSVVGNPGCYPTSIQIGLAPLIQAQVLISNQILVDAKSGFSGAGRKAEASLLASELAGNFKAYATGGHRHQPEIAQGLNSLPAQVDASVEPLQVTFVPHLLPLVRGIESSIYVQVSEALSLDEIWATFEAFYADAPFVDLLPLGQMPEIKSVAGTNKCQLGINRIPGSPFLLVSAVIDNLIKGAAGQAIQNMNLLFDLPETSGLMLMPHYP